MQTFTLRHALLLGGISALVCLTFSFTASGANLLVDPGLELGTPGTGNGTNGGWNAANGAVKNSTFTNHTAGGHLSLRLPPGSNSVPLIWQNIGSITSVGSVTAGMQFDLTAFGFITNTITTGRAGVQASFYDSSFVNLGTVETGPGVAIFSNNIDSNSAVRTWIPLDTGVFTAPAGTAYMQVFGIGIFLQPNGNSVWLDDFDLELVAVPEPSTVALAVMGLFSLFMVARCRRT
jgi:hypothetical protein